VKPRTRKRESASLALLVSSASINIYWLPEMFGVLGSRTKHPRDTDPALQRDHVLQRDPRDRRQGGVCSPPQAGHGERAVPHVSRPELHM
jgi:hypothetical protein